MRPSAARSTPRAGAGRAAARRALAGVAAVAVAAAGTAAGVGWLYLLRDVGALGAGPVLHDALALERLAGHDGQPLLRVLAAYVPAGAAVSLALRRLTGRGRAGRALLAGLSAYAMLIAAGAASDAVTRSQALAPHVAAQPGRPAVWLPALVLALCAAGAPERRASAARPPQDAARRWSGAARRSQTSPQR